MKWWGKGRERVQVFVRHCYFSEVSQHKKRLKGFSYEKCFENLMQTVDRERVELTFLLDTFHGEGKGEHFVMRQKEWPVVEVKEGCETGSFLRLLDWVEGLELGDGVVVYFVEDDYLHREGWVEVLEEGFEVEGARYVTLYDHRDKYGEMYKGEKSEIFCGKKCHWRETPSTTNTYAMKMGTLREHMGIHRKFSEGRRVTLDHEKFLELGRVGGRLVSPIPGWSTHVEDGLTSPCVDWEKMLLQEVGR